MLITACNKENGSFSQLWGRDCWVADSMLKLIQAHVDTLHEQSQSEDVDRALMKIDAYCKDLRKRNAEEYWPGEVGVVPIIGS